MQAVVFPLPNGPMMPRNLAGERRNERTTGPGGVYVVIRGALPVSECLLTLRAIEIDLDQDRPGAAGLDVAAERLGRLAL